MRFAERSPARALVRGFSALLSAALVVYAFADDLWLGGGLGFGAAQAILLAVGLVLGVATRLSFEWNARLLALATSTLGTFVFADRVVERMFSARFRSEHEFDARLLYRLAPGAVHRFVRDPANGGDRITCAVNRQGFRGDELEARPEFRIVVYGDSFVHGDYSALPNTFVARLDRHLAQRTGRDVEVINAGVTGYGPDQVLRRMERELGALAPDLVLVAIFSGNDFGDPLRNKSLRLDANGALQENAVRIDPALERDIRLGRRESVLKRLIGQGLSVLGERIGWHSAPASDIARMSPGERMEAFLARRVLEWEQYVEHGDDVVHDLAFDDYDADVSLTPGAPSARYKIALLDRIVAAMKDRCAASRVPLALIAIPHPIDVGGHATGAIDPDRHPEHRPERLTAIIAEIATRNGVPVVDLFPEFSRRGSAALYFRGFDDHWNDAGQDLAAAIVADSLIAWHLLDAGSTR